MLGPDPPPESPLAGPQVETEGRTAAKPGPPPAGSPGSLPITPPVRQSPKVIRAASSGILSRMSSGVWSRNTGMCGAASRSQTEEAPARRRPPGRHRHLVPSTRPPDARPASICPRPLLNSSTPQSLFLQLCRPRWPACLLTTMQTSFHASRLVCMPACLFACLSACLFASKRTSLPACMYACLLAQAIARRTLRWSGRQGRRTALAGSVALLELPPQPAPLPRWGSGDLFGFGCGSPAWDAWRSTRTG